MHIDLFYELSVPKFANRSELQVFQQTIKEITLADQLGFNAVWLVEHHFMPEFSHSAAPDLVLSALTQCTRQIRLGLAIIPLPYHHPVHIAERIATLDILSQGRVEVGFGRGFQPREYQIFGAEIANSRQLTFDNFNIIQSLLRKPSPKHNDPGPLGDVQMVPNCLQNPHPPFWMAAVSPDSYRIAAELAVGVLCGPFKPWFMIKEDIKRYRSLTAHLGHQPRVAMSVGLFCLEDEREAKKLAKPAFEWFYQRLFTHTRPIISDLYQSYEYYHQYRWFQSLLPNLSHYAVLKKLGMIIVGNPEHCIRKLTELQVAGVDHVMLSIGGGVLATEQVQTCLRLLGSSIMPAFRTPSQ